MEKLEHLKKSIERLISNYESQVEQDYYLGMSDEDASYEDGKASMAEEILSDLKSLV